MNSTRPNFLVFPTTNYPFHRPVSLRPVSSASSSSSSLAVSCTNEAVDSAGELTARERRQLRQERRESSEKNFNWKEEVEDRFLEDEKNRAKNRQTLAQKLSLTSLTELGPQWWGLRILPTRPQETAQRLSTVFTTNFPGVKFKIYNPTITERKFKDGFYTVKKKPLIPGKLFLYCTLNRLVHDFVKGCRGVGGFMGLPIKGRTAQFIIKPRPVSAEEIEEIFKREAEEQEKIDRAALEVKDKNKVEKKTSKKRVKKEDDHPYFSPGVNVRVLSGPFEDYTGSIHTLDVKNGKVNVDLTIFGKKSYVDLDINQIDPI